MEELHEKAEEGRMANGQCEKSLEKTPVASLSP